MRERIADDDNSDRPWQVDGDEERARDVARRQHVGQRQRQRVFRHPHRSRAVVVTARSRGASENERRSDLASVLVTRRQK
eukprot:5887572-Pleurochrysis_carterae.AAC.1